MRTTILISSIAIADAINPSIQMSSSVTNFYAVISIVFMVMDIVEFSKYLRKK